MLVTLNDHISFLDRRIERLSRLLSAPSLLLSERDQIEREIELASTAVGHYRRGFAIEERVKGKVIEMPHRLDFPLSAA